MMVDVSPLANAVARLDEGLERYRQDTTDAQIRDGLIQRFEFTYDIATKMLRRVIAAAEDNPGEADAMTFPTLIRTGWEQGLVPGGWLAWEGFRKLRNQTSHTYDQTMAIAAAERIPAFLEEVRVLAENLRLRAAP